MIRFCDDEVCCVLHEELDRDVILQYFFHDHLDKMVCVLDAEGKYKGKITYYSLLNEDNIFDAVREDYVVLDQDIWINSRNFFSNTKNCLNEHVLLPIVNENKELICFAYEDNDANREIRMLRELSENTRALQFLDIYPEYLYVNIYEFNELAFFFSEYLKKQGVTVQVFGKLWDFFSNEVYGRVSAFKCMDIYAEGISPKRANWIDNLLESVSVEFECIDKIYETNLQEGIFLDSNGGFLELIGYLKGKKEVVILGSGYESQAVYDCFFRNGIDIYCFVNENYGECSHRLFGKEILKLMDVRNKCKAPIFIECVSKHSAWGFGGTDYYDYIGYKRNESFFLIRDYVQIEGNNLLNILKNKKLVLLGDLYLCSYLHEFFDKEMIAVIGYKDDMSQNNSQRKMPEINFKDEGKDTVGLIVVPEYGHMALNQKQTERKRKLAMWLKDNGCNDYTDYFSHTSAYIDMEGNKTNKYTKESLIPKKMILGSIATNCGNTFFRELIDGHQSILVMDNGILSNCLFRYCICLANINSEDILPAFWNMYEKEEKWQGIIKKPAAFNKVMKYLLKLDKRFTSQELFVMFHLAYKYIDTPIVSKINIKNMIIYWEPHDVNTRDVEDFVNWLGNEKVRCDIVNIVRNNVMRNGDVKRVLHSYKDNRYALNYILDYPFIGVKEYLWGDRLVVRFEDIKSNPKKILKKICDEWDIEWSDTLMMTTENGVESFYNNGEYVVSGFDLKPVYNINEKYFSEFDRFRIMLLSLPWQKKYGYPYIETVQFSKRELQEIFMKKFRFEYMINFHSVKLEREFKIGLFYYIRNNLQKVRMIETMYRFETDVRIED